ncbi:DUF6438 domain-containing protein [Flavobacterium agrisoli]|uniref:DUF6438 domain-containing protein n=1 Tax=Flavobacterium agrisoli TaxID=2793066 RepID=A0A934UJV2_9FLAO|nr:hypothetical protein [Flavobacterium agrisoli]MBK0369903.1 hypothetical protein [Flavobacterium agrisoli]
MQSITKIILILFLLTLISCNRKTEEENPIKYFEFSYGDTFGSSFTMVYKPKDSLYIRQHWSSSEVFDSLNIPQGKTNYSAKISESDEQSLVKVISKLKLRTLKNEYFEDYSDGRTYAIFINNDSIKKLIKVHSHNAPKELDSLAGWIYQLKQKLKLKKTEKELNFKSAEYVLPPPPPPSIEKKKGI